MSGSKLEIESFENDLNHLDNVSEIFFRIHDVMRSGIGSDGEAVLVKNGDGSYYMVNETGWRELQGIHEQFLKDIFDQDGVKILNDNSKLYEHIDEFAGMNASRIDTLILFPVRSEQIEACVIAWKNRINEKQHVMVPLIVGSEMIGMTTQMKSKIVENGFDENIVATLNSLGPVITKVSSLLKEKIDWSKRRLSEQLDNIESEESITEIAKILIGQLMGVATSLENVKSVLKLIKKDAKGHIRLNENIGILEESVTSMDKNILASVLKASENGVMRKILGEKVDVDTLSFFEKIIYPYIIESCEKSREAVCYMDTGIPKNIFLDVKSSYLFVNTLIRHLFDQDFLGKKIHFNIRKSLQNTGLFLEILCQDIVTDETEESIRNQIITESAPKGLALLYEAFVRSGGTFRLRSEPPKSLLSYTFYIPAQAASELPVADIEIPKQTKVGFIIDREKDYLYANNMARYLFSLELEKGKFIASEKLSLINDESLTHLVVFESKFDKKFFKEELKGKNLVVLIVKEGCPQKDETVLLDYSYVDMEMHKHDKHLRKLEEFLILGRGR
jgi:hypothetical protein